MVIACGRSDYGDDAAGPLAARQLWDTHLPSTEVCIQESPDVDLLDRLAAPTPHGPPSACELLILLDAALASPHHPAGTWLRIDYLADPQTLPPRAAADSHSLGLADMLELGRTLAVLPAHVWIYAVFGQRFNAGDGPTPEVQRAVPQLASIVARDIRGFLASDSRR